uniref:Unclassified n=1 Tax=Fusarium clavum TaxID=2594811 RepID=W1I9P7_9HYPO|nr:unclassified [Fusarium clavum]CEF82657.1 unclassified [Fusarium clavum]
MGWGWFKVMEGRVCRVGRSATVELKASLGRIRRLGDGMRRIQGRQDCVGRARCCSSGGRRSGSAAG